MPVRTARVGFWRRDCQPRRHPFLGPAPLAAAIVPRAGEEALRILLVDAGHDAMPEFVLDHREHAGELGVFVLEGFGVDRFLDGFHGSGLSVFRVSRLSDACILTLCRRMSIARNEIPRGIIEINAADAYPDI